MGGSPGKRTAKQNRCCCCYCCCRREHQPQPRLPSTARPRLRSSGQGRGAASTAALVTRHAGWTCCPLPSSAIRTSALGSRPVRTDQPAPAWRTRVTLTWRRGLPVRPGCPHAEEGFSASCSTSLHFAVAKETGSSLYPLGPDVSERPYLAALLFLAPSKPCSVRMPSKRHAAPGLSLPPFPPLLAEKLRVPLLCGFPGATGSSGCPRWTPGTSPGSSPGGLSGEGAHSFIKASVTQGSGKSPGPQGL